MTDIKVRCRCGTEQVVTEQSMQHAQDQASEHGAQGWMLNCYRCEAGIVIVGADGHAWNTLAASVIE